jgi:thiamine monophosphate kinase
VAEDPERLVLQTRGGEDYQLLLAVPPTSVDALMAIAEGTQTRLTDIGEVVVGEAAELIGAAWPSARFDHFGPQP